MINLKKARELIEKVSYHGMLFYVDEGQFLNERHNEVMRLVIRHRVLDAETLKPNEVTHIFNYRYDMIYSEEEFYHWVWKCVKDRILHEAAEFFLIDGKRAHDPHEHDIRANAHERQTPIR